MKRKIAKKYRAIVDKASDRDRRFFEQHPELSEYVRPLIPGEFGGAPEEREYTHVHVVQIWPGFRNRHLVRLRMTVPPGASRTIH